MGAPFRPSGAARRLGLWSALAVAAIGVAYVAVLAAGFRIHGLREPIADPVLAFMEVLTLLSAPPILVLVAAVHDGAAAERRVYGRIAVAFAALFAGTTSVVHFVELTARRQTGASGIVWPSAAYAAELLAWDVFLGLALLFAAPVLDGRGAERAARIALTACGALCLAGIAGPVLGNMRIQLIGVFGYAVVLPLACLLLARLFARAP